MDTRAHPAPLVDDRGTATADVADLRPPAPRSATLRQIRSFLVIGVVSTAAYLVLYTLLRSVAPAAIANIVALVATAVGNTAANRRMTFAVKTRDGLARDHLAGLIALGVAIAITTASIAVLGTIAPKHSRAIELAVLVAANALATVVRFVLLRTWIDRPRSLPSLTGIHPERTSR